MARKDTAEADRLDDTCPRLAYRMDDGEFRDRMKRAYTIALLASVNLQKLLAVVRAGQVFRDQHHV